MAFDIVWDPKSLKFLDKLPKDEAKRIVTKMDIARNNPMHYAERLVDSEIYKIRIGDYRVFIDVYTDENVIKVRSIRHRRNAYKY